MKKILLIQAHPVKDTYADQLFQAYKKGALSAGADVKELILKNLNFNINFSEGYRGKQELEPDLVLSQNLIDWADHLVFVYPNWWGTYPALLKGFIDRTFLPGFAFKFEEGKQLPVQLLKGKSARLIVTMDTPNWYYKLIQGAPGHQSMRKAILNFCGIAPVKISSFGPIRKSSEKQRGEWLKTIERYGKNFK